MRRGWGPARRALLLLWLARLTLPGDGNDGSATGSCFCRKRIPSGSRPPDKVMDLLRTNLSAYNRCPSYIRFHALGRTLCGGSQEPWVLELVSCFDSRECGHDQRKSSSHQGHSLPPSTVIPEPTDVSSREQTPTLPSGAAWTSLDTEPTHLSETPNHTSDAGPGAGPEAGGNEKQQEEKEQKAKPGAAPGTSAKVPVLSLLAIVFILTGVTLYVLCRGKAQPQPYSPDLELHYELVKQDSNA